MFHVTLNHNKENIMTLNYNPNNITPLTTLTITQQKLIKQIKQSTQKSINPFKNKHHSNNKSNQQKIPINSNNQYI